MTQQLFTKENLLLLKQNVDLVFFIGSSVKLVQQGKRFVGSCPLHSDEGTTLIVSPQKRLWYCHGSCKRGGSIIDWLMHTRRVGIGGALAYLAEQFPFLASNGQMGELGINQALPRPEAVAKYQSILLQVLADYAFILHKHKKAVRYLRSLGLSYPAFQKFKIGYCDQILAQTLTNSPNDNKLIVKELLELGILGRAKNGLNERFAGSLVLPAFDASGQCVQVYARKIPKDFQEMHIKLLEPLQKVS